MKLSKMRYKVITKTTTKSFNNKERALAFAEQSGDKYYVETEEISMPFLFSVPFLTPSCKIETVTLCSNISRAEIKYITEHALPKQGYDFHQLLTSAKNRVLEGDKVAELQAIGFTDACESVELTTGTIIALWEHFLRLHNPAICLSLVNLTELTACDEIEIH